MNRRTRPRTARAPLILFIVAVLSLDEKGVPSEGKFVHLH